MLLHGPPGTGKTLIARQIGKMLNGKEPKVRLLALSFLLACILLEQAWCSGVPPLFLLLQRSTHTERLVCSQVGMFHTSCLHRTWAYCSKTQPQPPHHSCTAAAAVVHQVVNGPEVLSKYVGQAEENIRNLFGEAEAEYKEKGDASVSVRCQLYMCLESLLWLLHCGWDGWCCLGCRIVATWGVLM
jgi:DNA polymerase III delta prime subunit